MGAQVLSECTPAAAAREPGQATAAAEHRVHLQTGRWSRARLAVMLPVLALAATGGGALMLLFKVLADSNSSPPARTLGGRAIMVRHYAQPQIDSGSELCRRMCFGCRPILSLFESEPGSESMSARPLLGETRITA